MVGPGAHHSQPRAQSLASPAFSRPLLGLSRHPGLTTGTSPAPHLVPGLKPGAEETWGCPLCPRSSPDSCTRHPGCLGTPSTSSPAWQRSATLGLGPHRALHHDPSQFSAGRCPGAHRQEAQACHPPSPGRDHGPRQPSVSNTHPGDRDGTPPPPGPPQLIPGRRLGQDRLWWSHMQRRARPDRGFGTKPCVYS